MKKMMSVLLFVMISGILYALPESEREVVAVFDAPGLTKTQLFERTLEWMALSFGAAQEVIQYKDKDAGKIIGKGITSYGSWLETVDCRYTIVIEMKDNKVRMSFNNFFTKLGAYAGEMRSLSNDDNFDTVKGKCNAISENLKTYLSKKQSSEW